MTELPFSRWEWILFLVVAPLGILRWLYVGDYLTAGALLAVTVGFLIWRLRGGGVRIFDV